MAEFDPFAALAELNKTSGAVLKNANENQQLLARGGLQDLLARREQGDMMNRIAAQGDNSIESVLAQAHMPTNRAIRVSGNKQLPDMMGAVRNANIMKDVGAGSNALAEAGIFPIVMPGMTPSTLSGANLTTGPSTRVAASAASNPSITNTSGNKTVTEYVPDARKPFERRVPLKITEETSAQEQAKIPAPKPGTDVDQRASMTAASAQAMQEAMKTGKWVNVNGQRLWEFNWHGVPVRYTPKGEKVQ